MIIISEKAEERLSKYLTLLSQTEMSKRLLKIENNAREGISAEKIAEIVTPLLHNKDSFLFECNDGDIFILAFGINYKTVEKIDHFLSTHRRKYTTTPSAQTLPLVPTQAAIVFDVQKDERIISTQIKAKLEQIEREQRNLLEEKKRIEKNKREQLFTDLTFDQNLLQSIEKRRAQKNYFSILLVEDDSFTRALITNTLKLQGTVITAQDAIDAVIKYPVHTPDIVFLDIDLPDLSGLEVLRKILKFDLDAFVVMLSGHSHKHNIITAMQEGAKGFIGKPFSKEKLYAYLEKCPHFNKTTLITTEAGE